ncbi:hypothetical protein [Allorhodopirellula solitaria]|uniref:Uncharacterized protein n=1 Tax=Allorhodopirellula solitaria TaxID=2527987 RepID=A0A5C5X0I0_9BACT|nr:hypothetical protein [Allorhodopirellula solitaria]TWT56497.1 hypothetical protein CA85_40280 [Allorhodopirellula solitaria]
MSVKPNHIAADNLNQSDSAHAVDCRVSGGQAHYRFNRGCVTTHYEFIGVRPGVSGVGELIEITDHVDSIRDSFPGNTFEGYARLVVLEPGQVRPLDVVTTECTLWSHFQFDVDEWADDWCRLHDIEHMSDDAFTHLYEMTKAEARSMQNASQGESEVGR